MDIAGEAHIRAVCAARAKLTGEDEKALLEMASRPVDFYPASMQSRLNGLLSEVGRPVCPAAEGSAAGAGTREFDANSKLRYAPLSGLGYFRLAEDGRLYFLAKSEHYHLSLGHGFPGYELIETARRLGIPNATHNNTRGHITRLLEGALIRSAAGLGRDDADGMREAMESESLGTLNRVLNLETGSLAAEAALKLALGRFYRAQDNGPEPPFAGMVPVVAVIGEFDGGLHANYHGTTMLTQVMRGMWPAMLEKLEAGETLLVRAARPNRPEDLDALFEQYNAGKYRIAAVFHELVMMNYGAVRLTESFVHKLYAMCAAAGTPVAVDEIQSCAWSPELFLFKEYGVRPSMVAVGKGFPGGEYPASRLLFSAALDCLPQFGALVTNGQEELASLAYLITMRWVEANAEAVSRIGEYYEERLRGLGDRYGGLISGIGGRRHMAGIGFHDLAPAKAFAAALNGRGIDIGVQTYKQGCPPVALTKLPLTVNRAAVDFVVARMDEALRSVQGA